MDVKPIKNYIIRCSNLPLALLSKIASKDHFSQFGKVISIHLRPKTKGCTVEYANEEGFQCALSNAGKFNGQTFKVSGGGVKSPKTSVAKLWTPNMEVQQELEAMGGTSDYKMGSSKIKEKKSKTIWGTPKKSATITKVTEPSTTMNINVSSEQRELLNVIKQPAHSVDEKYKVLEARDKLIRLRSHKHVDLGAMHTVGTCPDMCPEKERLMREVQHQVALYEQEPSTKTMNHCLAVKQYSRSSADQESPLPHELRSVTVLRMTMGYLLHKIIPLCDNLEVNLAEWYHFLWDRTRGIRKDITQQELCCQGSVELVEQCARFHIHCSARLIAEDPSVFDQKINTENLTKCLQTLKYMYHDLLCKNEYCKNEAEFRGYIILLNLNDANFMWEVQQLRDDIQKSQPVQFAIKVYSALDKNNYVNFFKLVKSTSYLNACILLRYFIQVRVRALQTILKAFSPRGLTKFPLEELKEILAFEGDASTRDFVEYYGLFLHKQTEICLNRNNFNIPELPYTLDRAMNVVESKKTLNISEIISGGDLPLKVYENHRVHSSFDEFGYLITLNEFNDYDFDEKIEEKQIFAVKKIDSRSNSPLDVVDFSNFTGKKIIFGKHKGKSNEESQSSMDFESETSKTGFESIFKNKSIENKSIFGTKSIFPANSMIFQQPQSIFKPTPKFSGGFNFKLTPEKEMGSKLIENDKNLEEDSILNLQKHEEEMIREKIIEEKRQRELKEIQRIENERKRIEIERENERKRIEIERENERKRILEEQKMFEEEQKKKKIEEERIRKKLELEKKLEIERIELKKKIQMEKQRIEEHKKMMEIRKNVSILVNDLLIKVEEKNRIEKLQEIKEKLVKEKMKIFLKKWFDLVMMRKRKRKAIDDWPIWIENKSREDEAFELMQNNQNVVLMDMKRYKSGEIKRIETNQENVNEKLNLDDVFMKIFKNDLSKTEFFWKIDFCFSKKPNLKKIEEKITFLLDFKSNCYQIFEKRLNYCFKKHDYFQNELTNGFIFINDVFDEDFYLNVKQTIENHYSNTTLPAVFILNSFNSIYTEKIDDLNLISNYAIFQDTFTLNNLKSLIKKSLFFLTKNIPKFPVLKLDDFNSFLFKYLSGETWERINNFSEKNRAFGMSLCNPKNVFYLYKKLIKKLELIVFNENLLKNKDFPKIFTKNLDYQEIILPCNQKYFPSFWKNESYNRKLKRIFENLKLPETILIDWPPSNIFELKETIENVCTQLKCPSKTSFLISTAIIQNLESIGNFDSIKYMMWTDLIKMIINEKLKSIDFTLREPFVSESFFQLFVIYDQKDLENFEKDYWFFNDELIQKDLDASFMSIEQPEDQTILEDDFNLDKIYDEVMGCDHQKNDITLKSKSEMNEIREMLNDLEESVSIHKKISSRFQATLLLQLK